MEVFLMEGLLIKNLMLILAIYIYREREILGVIVINL